MASCRCGCGRLVSGRTRNGPRRYVSGHNLRALKKTAEHRAAISEGQRRAWQTKRTRLPLGTTRRDAHGYTLVKVHAGKGRWALQHALVMEKIIGRPLARTELIHHINGDRGDNRPENLYLCRSRSHHNAVHGSQDTALRLLLAAGYVRFTDGRYEAVLRGHR